MKKLFFVLVALMGMVAFIACNNQTANDEAVEDEVIVDEAVDHDVAPEADEVVIDEEVAPEGDAVEGEDGVVEEVIEAVEAVGDVIEEEGC